MKRNKFEKTSARAQAPPWVRASISFPSDLYETLDEIAKQKKVSLAWVVRDAAEKYVEGRNLSAEAKNMRAK
jgi:metal-responsive CopG/Arc/MetJ family transcriptional regulator